MSPATTTGAAQAESDTFSGFRSEAIQFLADLAANNDRAWFQPRKADYERLLKRPLEQLCVALQERFERDGLPLRADPARSPFRIYRDVRFSKDKSPYKTNIGASFPWTGGGDLDAGGYFHFEPGQIYVGGGMWHPEPARLAAVRGAIAADPDAMARLLEEPDFAREFGSIGGDKLKRVPTGFPADHPAAELLKHKDFTFGRRLSDAQATSPNLPDVLAASFATGVPVMRFLATAGT
jgi:uncharacterized protein (TIGR02453 family)